MKTDLKIGDLVKLYKEAESADTSIFAEQRSNLLLAAGNHYQRRGSRFWNRIRDDKSINQEQRLRLTKNHVQRVCKIYENSVLSFSPDVAVMPRNESELQDQKAAELNESVWQYTKYQTNWDEFVRKECQNYIRIGEAAVKVFWDPTKGKLSGYEQAVNPDDHPLSPGAPSVDEMGQPVPDKEKPVFSGALQYEPIFGFNLLRDRAAKTMDDSRWLGLRKMVDTDDLKLIVGDDEEKQRFIKESRDETYVVFDGQNSGYTSQTGQCLVIEIYFRPCPSMPNGYYYIFTTNGILFEGELPFGLFPIKYVGFEDVPTQPRSHSIIKVCRPFQAEINRMASCIAETQVTIGQDKIITAPGSKIANGGMLNGVRAVQVAGPPPVILPGRAGDQYLPHMQATITELYQTAMVEEETMEQGAQVDPYTMLFQSIRNKKKYSVYAGKFTRYLTSICELSLSLLKEHLTDEMLIPQIGRSEFVNISEFKTANPLCYTIKLAECTSDMESQLGKQLTFNQILQYAGSQLDPKNLGRLIRNAPYLNQEETFDDLTMDYDNSVNMILALDRGQQPQPNPSDDAMYMVKRLTNRTRKADFSQLQPQIQSNYENLKSAYLQMDEAQKQKIAEAAQGFIPMQGYAVVCDLYVPMPDNPQKTQRARVPYDALVWLLKRLEDQGASQQQIMGMSQGNQAQMAELFLNHQGQGGSQNPGMAMQGSVSQPSLTQQ